MMETSTANNLTCIVAPAKGLDKEEFYLNIRITRKQGLKNFDQQGLATVAFLIKKQSRLTPCGAQGSNTIGLGVHQDTCH